VRLVRFDGVVPPAFADRDQPRPDLEIAAAFPVDPKEKSRATGLVYIPLPSNHRWSGVNVWILFPHVPSERTSIRQTVASSSCVTWKPLPATDRSEARAVAMVARIDR
jgi:hypothetical protein